MAVSVERCMLHNVQTSLEQKTLQESVSKVLFLATLRIYHPTLKPPII